jgi:hypothetical protein
MEAIMMQRCTIHEVELIRGLRGVVLSNPFVSITVLPDKGADICSLVHRASGVDVMARVPNGLRAPGQGVLASHNQVAWMEMYEGGWQEILPNGGDPCEHKGVELTFHGESTTLPWSYRTVAWTDEEVAVEFEVQLFRSPFHLRRRMILNARQPAVRFEEEVTNLAAEPMEFMWGHHPAYGAPFLSADTRLYTNAQTVVGDNAGRDGPSNAILPGSRGAWPMAAARGGGTVDLSIVPGEDSKRAAMGYLMDFAGDPWYALVNHRLQFGVGFAFTPTVWRTLWFWQEMRSRLGWPWYGRTYIMAVEPWSSWPGQGLANVLNTTKTHHTLPPEGKLAGELLVTLFDLAPGQSLKRVDLKDGAVSA